MSKEMKEPDFIKGKIFESISIEKDKLLAEFNQIDTKYKLNNLMKGEELEDLLMRCLENILNCGIGKGFVVNNKGEFSKQCDLILYRNSLLKFPPYFRNNTFPIELVYGIIEVKTSLNKSELKECIEKIKVFKSIIPSSKGPPSHDPFGVIFSFKGNKLNTIAKNYDEIRKSIGENFYLPNFIYNLSEGIILHGESMNHSSLCLHSYQFREEYYKSCPLSVFKENSHFSLFIFLLFKLLDEFISPKFEVELYFF